MHTTTRHLGLTALVILIAHCSRPAAALDPKEWTVVYELSAKIDVSVDPDRLFHGPAAARAPNGDWLVCYQDSIDHGGRDGVITQVRSTDEGRTWKKDGIVFDQRKDEKHHFARNPAYGVTGDGQIILFVQRWLPSKDKSNEGIKASVWLTSCDNGQTYRYRGVIDTAVPLRHGGTNSPILRHRGVMMAPAVSPNIDPVYGIPFYTLTDPEKGWQYGSTIFRSDELGVETLSYGSLITRSDGSLLAQCLTYSRNFQSVSRDDGRTWSRPRRLKDLDIRNNADLDYAGNVLVAHGRGADARSVVVYFSPDEGKSWGYPIVLDRLGFYGWGGYSASLRTEDGDLFIVFSTDAGPNTGENGGKPDVRGVLLSDVRIRRRLPGQKLQDIPGSSD